MIQLQRGSGAPLGLITEPGELRDVGLCERACALLQKHYPDHGWSVKVKDGRIEIRLAAFIITGKHAYVIYEQDWGADLDAEIVRGGGESLERNRIARSGRTESTYEPTWFGFLKQAKRGD